MAKTFHPMLCYTILLLISFGMFGLTLDLRAQAVPLVTGPGSYITVGGGASLFQQDYGDRKVGGLTIFADINPTWRFGIEAEARFLHYHESEKINGTTYLAGPRISICRGPLRPYVKLLVGAGKIDLPFGYAQGTFFTWAPGGGFDYALNKRTNIRLVDFEYQRWTKFPYGPLHPYGLSMGISFRITGDFHIARRGHY